MHAFAFFGFGLISRWFSLRLLCSITTRNTFKDYICENKHKKFAGDSMLDTTSTTKNTPKDYIVLIDLIYL